MSSPLSGRLLLHHCRQSLRSAQLSTHPSTSSLFTCFRRIPAVTVSSKSPFAHKRQISNMTKKEDAHQYQSGSSTDRDIDQWKHREPYRVHEKADNFDVKWEGQCHCGKVQYQLSREKPLAAKYCHCTTCQRLHGVSIHLLVDWHDGVIDHTLGTVSVGSHIPQGRYQLHTRAP